MSFIIVKNLVDRDGKIWGKEYVREYDDGYETTMYRCLSNRFDSRAEAEQVAVGINSHNQWYVVEEVEEVDMVSVRKDVLEQLKKVIQDAITHDDACMRDGDFNDLIDAL